MWVAYKLAQMCINDTFSVVLMGCNYLRFVALMATNVCCSIELEPKTLSPGQLHQAREVAADVQKMKENEASVIFIKGLEGVEEEEKNEEKLQKEAQLNIAYDHKIQVIERPCQCSLNNNIVESPDQINLKEPLSAPF